MSQQSQPKLSYGYKAANMYAQAIVTIAAAGLALLLLMLLWSPCIITSNVNATDATGTTDNTDVSTQTVAVPEPTLSVSLGSEVELDIVPTNTGTTSSASTNLSVTTTDSDSYSVYLSAEDNGALVSADPDNTATIANTDTASTLAGLEANTWGYALSGDTPTSSTLYQALPTNTDTAILTVDTATTDGASDTYYLSFGTKVDGNLPADTYTTEVTVSVVAAPRAPTLSDITYMQDMTPSICAASQENETKRLIDSRDGKYYWVAKLADGNCWMTQNLALELNGITLTPEDSDVSAEWSPGDVMFDVVTQDALDASTIRGWYFGEYVNFRPTEFADSVYCGGEDYVYTVADCPNYFLDVSGWSAQQQEAQSGEVLDEADMTYDAHYLIGAYYTWVTATAGTGRADLSYTTATGSICPKGWQLPARDSTSSTFSLLLGEYGFENTTITNSYNLSLSPLYLFRGGFIYDTSLAGVHYRDGANNGAYWTATTTIAGNGTAAIMNFIKDNLYFNNSAAQRNGLSVRCLSVSQ